MPGLDNREVQLAMSLADRIGQTGRAITAKDLAGFLSVSEVTIFRHAAAGRIPSFRVGSCFRFDPKAVATWLRKILRIGGQNRPQNNIRKRWRGAIFRVSLAQLSQ